MFKTQKVSENCAGTHNIIRYHRDGCEHVRDRLIEEVPVALEYNGIAYTVMMCTPADLEEFAFGFSLTEGIIMHDRDIHDIEFHVTPNGITLSVRVANRCLKLLQEKRRSLAGMTGCGICGVETLQGVARCVTPLRHISTLNISCLEQVLSQLAAHQPLNQVTGASHAAAYISAEGQLVALFEDVGRHIALDKLVGWIVRNHVSQGAILVTSRASFEMVQKVVMSGIEILFAVSAATSMAVEVAQRLNLTLCGYCREGRANVYSHPERVLDQKASQAF
jgi:FdhD protein